MLWRCEICGDPIVSDKAPSNCPFCGAASGFVKPSAAAKPVFDIALSDIDKAHAETAITVEVNNSSFYFCSAKKGDDEQARLLFRALAKIEAEHAAIWRKILKLEKAPEANEQCSESARENLEGSHAREAKAIDFYRKAANECLSKRLKQIFGALVKVESDHLKLSGDLLIAD